jgi:hypothetical protein
LRKIKKIPTKKSGIFLSLCVFLPKILGAIDEP